MKIEIGESLIYTWLRHVKGCQIVQTNWRPSEFWSLSNQSDLQNIMNAIDQLFPDYSIFGHKTKVSLQQYLAQAEIDVMGAFDFNNNIIAVDVAYHESGLGYGSSVENVARILKKCLRSAMCIYGYFNRKSAEIVFATPKIHKSDWPLIFQSINELEVKLNHLGFGFVFKVICDQSSPDFQTEIFDAVMGVMNNICDSNELFVRSAQLLQMFYNISPKTERSSGERREIVTSGNIPDVHKKVHGAYSFKTYLGAVTNSNGCRFSSSTINNYSSALNYTKFQEILEKHGLPTDINLCTDITKLKTVYDELKQQNTILSRQIHADRHGACTSALREYANYLRKFLLATNDNNQIFD